MTATFEWPTKTIFISSTFKDMHAERDWLRSHVFPELRERLRRRRHHLEMIDLRLGVGVVDDATEEEAELSILKVCLNEIERSRPFMIVLLGDRYGWVPPQERMEWAIREAGFKTYVMGKSVTAMEVEFGIFKKDANQRQRVLIYFRDPLPYGKMPPDVAARYSDEYLLNPQGRILHEKLQALKWRLKTDGYLKKRIRRYHASWDRRLQRVTGLEAFGNMVLQDLLRELDGETQGYNEQPPATWEEQEQVVLAEFVEDCGRNVIGRSEILDQLLDLANSPAQEGVQWGVCVTGSPGSGKSSLFASLYRTLSQDPDCLVLAHAAGISSKSGQLDTMLRRWVFELAELLRIVPPLTKEILSEEVEKTFHAYLARASVDHRVVVLIDALNEFEPSTRARYLSWLPHLWPQNARFIATSVAGTESEALQKQPGIELKPIPPLLLEDAKRIVLAVCERYHRKFSSRLVNAIVSRKSRGGELAAGNPLWLNLAVEELNLLDADDFQRAEQDYSDIPVHRRLDQLLMDTAISLPAEVKGLYQWMLARSEEIYGGPLVKAFACITALSRFGWRELDLRVLVPTVTKLCGSDGSPQDWDDLNFAYLRRGFCTHLKQRGSQSQWNFSHIQMRQAVKDRYLADSNTVKCIHGNIVDHLLTLPSDDSLREAETMVHLIGTEDNLRSARYYSTLTLRELANATDILSNYIVCGNLKDPNPNLRWVESLLEHESLEQWQISAIAQHIVHDLSDSLLGRTDLSTSLCLLGAGQKALERLARDPKIRLIQSVFSATVLSDLVVCHDRVGRALAAKGEYEGALDAYRRSLAILNRLIPKLKQLPLRSRMRYIGAAVCTGMADVLKMQGRMREALEGYRESEEIFRELVQQEPENMALQRELSVMCNRIGELMLAQRDPAGALHMFREGLEIAKELADHAPTDPKYQLDLSASFNRIGQTLAIQNELPAALDAFKNALAIRQLLVVKDPVDSLLQENLAASYRRVGEILSLQGDVGGAVQAYQLSHNILAELHKADATNYRWSRTLICDSYLLSELYKQLGKHEEANEYRRHSLKTLRSIDSSKDLLLLRLQSRLENEEDKRGKKWD